MKKKVALLTLSFSTALAIGAVSLISQSGSFELATLAEKQAGSVTIDVSNPRHLGDEEVVTFSTELGNSIDFYSTNVSIEDGAYHISDKGFLRNESALNGITSFNIDVASSCSIILYTGYGYDDFNHAYYNLEEGLQTITISGNHPSCFKIVADSDFYFKSVTIFYTCVADLPSKEITQINTQMIDGYEARISAWYVEAGTELSEISLANNRVYTSAWSSFDISSDSEIQNLEIQYNAIESDVVVEGSNYVSISFIRGTRYYSESIELVGYYHAAYSVDSVYLSNNEYLQQLDDSIPESFSFQYSGHLTVYDSNNQSLLTRYSSGTANPSLLTLEFDEHPFTELGKHIVTVSYLNKTNYKHSYTIYNPIICNIRHISSSSTLEIEYGTPNEDFGDFISNVTFNVSYYEDSEELQHEIHLTEDNFILPENAFFSGAGYIVLPIVYQNYSDKMQFYIHYSRGKVPVEYTSDEPVRIFNSSISKIILYENGIADMYPASESDRYLSAYTLKGDILEAYFQGGLFRFLIDQVNHKFELYRSQEEPLYTLTVDFTALGAPMLYEGKMFSDNTIEFDIGGMIMFSNFTLDGEGDTIMYFNFAGMACVGVIDYENLIMVVNYATSD